MPSSPHRKRAEAAEALAAVAPLATRWIERLLAQQDPPLTVTQYAALRAISREEISSSDLARRSGVSGPAVSQLLAGLADDGLLERQVSEDDRRRLALALSATGQRAITAAERLLTRELGSLLAELPPPEADALSRLLPRVEAVLSGQDPPRRPPHPHPPPPPRRHPRARRP